MNYMVRDAEGLSMAEAVFLFVVDSRGTYTAGVERSMKDMRMSRPTYYRTRKSLQDRELIEVIEGFDPKIGKNRPTQITINLNALEDLQPRESQPETVSQRDSLSVRRRVSHTETRQSHSDNTEVHPEEAPKKNYGVRAKRAGKTLARPKEVVPVEPMFSVEQVQKMVQDGMSPVEVGKRLGHSAQIMAMGMRRNLK